jgi:nucleoside-diphosphate-sugar epimerase
MSVCLVTGGAGFIGSHLVEELLANGLEVRVLDNLSTGNLANLAHIRKRITLLRGDLADLPTVRAAVEDVEVVFHLGGLDSVSRSIADPLGTHQASADGTLHLLLAAREARVRRVVYAASASVYGEAAARPQRENDLLHPLSPHGVAKLTGEHYCKAFSNVFGLETVRLRCFNVFGPRQQGGSPHAAVVPLFVEAMLAGRRPVIYGDGSQSRDFIDVEDIVQANLLAADAPRVSGRVYNIGTGRRTTLLELVQCLNELLGTRIRPIHAPPRLGDIRHSQADITRAQADLGFCPCTDLERSLRRCLDYHAKRRKGPKYIRKQTYQVNEFSRQKEFKRV